MIASGRIHEVPKVVLLDRRLIMMDANPAGHVAVEAVQAFVLSLATTLDCPLARSNEQSVAYRQAAHRTTQHLSGKDTGCRQRTQTLATETQMAERDHLRLLLRGARLYPPFAPCCRSTTRQSANRRRFRPRPRSQELHIPFHEDACIDRRVPRSVACSMLAQHAGARTSGTPPLCRTLDTVRTLCCTALYSV